MEKLENKVAILTGGNSGIRLAMAKRLRNGQPPRKPNCDGDKS